MKTKTKYGKIVAFYLSLDAIEKLKILAGKNNKSNYLDNLIKAKYNQDTYKAIDKLYNLSEYK